jgi:RNA polymerase sigma-70 factor (ECF subfamily)
VDSSRENNFRQLFNTHHQKVFNIALNMIHNIEDAEEVTIEVFIKVYHSLDSFQGQSEVSTWIYRIAVNKSLDFLKAMKRKKRFAFFTQLFHPETGEPLPELSHFDHPGVLMENKERSQILFSAIDKLPETQKTAFVLAKIEGFPQKEVAQMMNLSGKAVESLVQRAKENLRRLLENFYQ